MTAETKCPDCSNGNGRVIDRLTVEQIARLPEFAERWTQIGLSCEPCDVKTVRPFIASAYRAAGLAVPKKIILCDSPLSCALAHSILASPKLRGTLVVSVRDSAWNTVWGTVGASVRERVWDCVWSPLVVSVRNTVGESVWDCVWDCVRVPVRVPVQDSVLSPVWDSVRASVWSSLVVSARDTVGESVRASVAASLGVSVGVSVGDPVGPDVWDSMRDEIYGSHEAPWLSFFDFMQDVLGLNLAKLEGLFGIAKHCGWWLPCANTAFVQHRHSEVHLKDRRLHCDGGPAVRYRDGFCVWSLNGVRVDQWIAETPTEQLDPQKMLEIENVQVRAEFVRKVGIERVWNKCLARTIETDGCYALGMLRRPGGGEIGPYLRMQNQSVEELWHVEGAHPSCRTIQEALNWRRYGTIDKTWKPKVLT